MESKHFFPSHSQSRIETWKKQDFKLEVNKGYLDSQFAVNEHCLTKCNPDFQQTSEGDKS